ncbi:hypothetical protein NDU88_003471 [Pleurodeles waltl]|uniref:Uncharacterized protein n=1 Tax=Pleurodeles waltl TaxID=8319 RepID=A0AAV7UE52_PLEWA|nr:hypothetical protein NDU88_003471 [Pleurodeles waltl]
MSSRLWVGDRGVRCLTGGRTSECVACSAGTAAHLASLTLLSRSSATAREFFQQENPNGRTRTDDESLLFRPGK